jgi:hypothetical protein
MQICKLKLTGVLLVAIAAVTGSGLLAQQALDPTPGTPVPAAGSKSKLVDSTAMAQTEAKLVKLRELMKLRPGEYVMNIAKIAWERDPWEAAVKAAREGKPVIAYGPGMVGVPCGYG